MILSARTNVYGPQVGTFSDKVVVHLMTFDKIIINNIFIRIHGVIAV